MEIKKGLVKWNGRNDIPCTYAEMEDGTKYYFKEDLANGNHIVTTSLLEAVDPMTKAQNVGLLGADGNLLIPCNNRSIKFEKGIDGVLFVEPIESDEANSLISDPSKYVSITAQIKDKTRTKIEEVIGAGTTPDYKFHNPASKVTLVDLDNNSLVDGNYYTSVAMAGDKLFLANNTLGENVIIFSIPEKKIVDEKVNAEVAVENVVSDTPTDVVANEAVSAEVPLTEVNSEVVIPSLDNNAVSEAKPVEESAPTSLSNIFENSSTEEVSIPTASEEQAPVDVNFSFGDIKEETPTEVVDSAEEVSADNYAYDSETEKSETDAYVFSNNFKEDTIERNVEEETTDTEAIDTEKSVVDDVSRILGGFGETISEKDEEIRVISEERDELRKENNNMKSALKESEARRSRDAMAISSLEYELEEAKAAKAEIESENQKLKARIETLEDTNDLYRRKEEETRRNMKILARAVKIYQAAGGTLDEEEVKVRAA